MFDAGAYTIAQSAKRCVVFGMPAKAIEAGGVRERVDLENIPNGSNGSDRATAKRWRFP